MQRQVSLLLSLAILATCVQVAQAEDCGPVPAHPARSQVRTPDPGAAYELSEKAYLSFEQGDFHCAAFFGLEAYLSQPEAVLVQNVANALKEGQQFDAALNYAEFALTLSPGEREAEAAKAMISELGPLLRSADYVALDLAELDADAVQIGWIRYQRGDLARLKKGTLELSIERKGAPPVVESLTLPLPPKEDELVEPAGGDDGWLLITGSVVAGVGVALLVSTVVVDSMAGSKRTEYDEIGDCLRSASTSASCLPYNSDVPAATKKYDDLGEEIDGLVGVETVTLAAGAVLTAAGSALLIWYLLSPSDSSASNTPPFLLSLSPNPRWDGGLVQFGVSF